MIPVAALASILLVRVSGTKMVGQAVANDWHLGVIVNDLCALFAPEALAKCEWLMVEAPGVQAAHWPKEWT